ncbi:MAG TPA: DUF2071 domain-containing protein [Verrucomicrobiales bacterium]|nr:DUF2071 domain-containing protein [Verrucomicrobiales bacterium]
MDDENSAGEASEQGRRRWRRMGLARSEGSPAGYQRWSDLLFLHWRVDPDMVQATLPRGLRVDSFDGSAWLGIVAFFMERIRPAFLIPLPWLSWFLELNLRTYVVDASGRPGVWFYSLDCNQPLAVWIGRRGFHLPYFHSRMRARRNGGTIVYHSARRGSGREATAEYVWRAPAAYAPAEPGSLAFFLVERYRLFSVDELGRLWTGQVRHAPYRVGSPAVKSVSLEPALAAGFHLEGGLASALAASRVDVEIFGLKTAEH